MKLLPVLVFVALALGVFATPAGAADLPASQSNLTSAAVQDGRLIWFQRNNRISHSKRGARKVKPGVGAIYARTLTSKRAQRVYLPPAGSRIVSLKVGFGRVVLGLATIAKENRGPSSIVELTPSDTPAWSAVTLATEADAPSSETCGKRVHLVGVRSDGEALAERSQLETRGENCLIVRQQSELIALSKTGTESSVGKRTSGWASAKKWNLLSPLIPISTTALIQFDPWGSTSGQLTSVWEPSSDSFGPLQGVDQGFESIALLGKDHLLLRDDSYSAEVFSPLASPMTLEQMINPKAPATSWYRACGDRLLEIHGGGKKWRLTLRKPNGDAIRTLKKKLPRGTAFDACDQNTAVFHRDRYNGGIRQWAVSLGA